MYLYISLFLLIIILNKKEILESKTLQYKIKKITDSGYIFSISLLPYFNKDNNDYLEFYKMIDYISSNKNIYKNNKISIKIRQLAKNEKDQQDILENIKKYANKNNVFVWISSVLKDDLLI